MIQVAGDGPRGVQDHIELAGFHGPFRLFAMSELRHRLPLSDVAILFVGISLHGAHEGQVKGITDSSIGCAVQPGGDEGAQTSWKNSPRTANSI
jgi:hypothetical protein